MGNSLTHLQRLEAESIHIMREAVAESERPVMLYSIGKDSGGDAAPGAARRSTRRRRRSRCCTSTRPGSSGRCTSSATGWPPRPAWTCSCTRTPSACALGINPFDHGSQVHTDMWKTEGLKQALDKYGFDAAFGGARRDEEKSRAKERMFSFRSAQHRWDPKQQRPELWRLYNAAQAPGRDASGCSRSRTGPSSTSGSTSTSRTSRSCRSTSRRRGRWSSATAR